MVFFLFSFLPQEDYKHRLYLYITEIEGGGTLYTEHTMGYISLSFVGAKFFSIL